jgi:diacylglycerol O-acyltransferase
MIEIRTHTDARAAEARRAPNGYQAISADPWAGRRLSPLDGSFLRLDSPSVHMHVGWSALFAAPDKGNRPTVEKLRARAAARLDDIGWCRWKLRNAPLHLTEPRWVQDRDFDLDAHIVTVSAPDEAISYDAFAALRDSLLSQPLDRSRALWQIVLVPRLEDGRVGLIGKIHHALVDGIAALQIVGLVLDIAPTRTPRPPADSPSPAPEATRRGARQRLAQPADKALAALRATAVVAARPTFTAGTALRDALRVARAARQDVLPRAPDSILNAPTGPRRTLVGYHASRADLRAARSSGETLNDIGLTMVAGALRALAIRRGEAPSAPLKAMVPISMRGAAETGPGNRIAMVYVQLPVNLPSPGERLEWVRAQMLALKDGGRGENMQTLYAAGGLLPPPLRSPLARAMASQRTFNLTVSQSPGPRGAVHLLGCELQEVYSVVPIAEGRSLAIGMVRYRKELFIGCYADPDALPEFRLLPALLETELRGLGTAPPGAENVHTLERDLSSQDNSNRSRSLPRSTASEPARRDRTARRAASSNARRNGSERSPAPH